MSSAIWYLQTTFDRRVAYPNEKLFASAAINNPNPDPIFIGSCYWYFTCYPRHSPGMKEVRKIVPPKGSVVLPPWPLPIPNVPEGQYEAEVSLDTWIWSAKTNNWQDLGKISPDRREPFFIIHAPRLRAFVSRSNHDVDRPIVEPIVSTIQQWGFDTHTVGIDEIEQVKEKVPGKIVQEIRKSDCVFAIATPRDVRSISALSRTLTWLHNEVSFSFMAQKPTLLIADESVLLNGIAGTTQIPTLRFSSADLYTFLLRLSDLMPVIRKIILEESYRTWQQKRIEEIETIRYESFIAGMVVQKRISSGE